MDRITNYVVDFTEELSKVGYCIVKAGANSLYKAKGELAAYTIQNYMNTRFEIRLEDFAYEQDKLSEETKRNFYDNIDHKKLNILYELLEQARLTAYDLHAKILTKLFVNFIKNEELNYYEKTLLTNINIFNEIDFKMYKFVMSHYYNFNNSKEKSIYSCTTAMSGSLNSIQKFLNLGFFTYPEAVIGKVEQNSYTFTDFIESKYSRELYILLSEIIDD